MLQIRSNPLHYRNVFARIILLTLENRLGKDVLNAVLYSAGLHHFITRYPASDFQQTVPAIEIFTLFETLESIHSAEETRVLAYQCGQAIACYLLAERQGQDMPGALPMRTIPLSSRQATGLQILSDLLSEFSTRHTLHTSPESGGYLFVLDTPGGTATQGVTHLMLGFLAEGMRLFALGEREYRADLVSLPGQRTGLHLHSLTL